ncbi:RpiB/LacA/LacB family sugar-phosphate isomerase [Candidatus Saccharibacteria bacterium]|nr:RpiB/LacA/LacB family sugar-phosphate isomerase [Candidatus Saccharibacteria bacterium]
MKIFIGADHQGFRLKNKLIEYLKKAGYSVKDSSNQRLNPEDDFPVFAAKVTNSILTSNDSDVRGILICGSGQGMNMAANRFRGIRACLGYDRDSVRLARNDDDSNVLCLPAHILDSDEAKIIVETWINTPFAGASRYIRRINELDKL